MYLWKRASGFTFQQRVPRNLPFRRDLKIIRVALGPISASEARRRARLLAGLATELMDDKTVTDHVLLHTLRDVSERLRQAEAKSFGASIRLVHARQVREAFQPKQQEGDDVWVPCEPEQIAVVTDTYVQDARNAKAGAKAVRQALQGVQKALEKDGVAWRTETATLRSMVRGDTITVSPQCPEAKRLFSEAATQQLQKRRANLIVDDNEATRYQERLEASVAAFIELVGDLPLEAYLPSHMQDFATALGGVPTNRNKYRELKGLGLREVIDKNRKLPPHKKRDTLSRTTIQSYVSEVLYVWSRVTADVRGVRDLRALQIDTPVTAAKAIDREGLPIDAINLWLADAASPQSHRQGKSWLPLLALLSGMRLTELIYLQRSDLQCSNGRYTFDLRKPLIVNGNPTRRPLKNDNAHRLVAVHTALVDLGFIAYVEGIRGKNAFLFPAFHGAKDPGDAAQKKMSKWMQRLAIHDRHRQVFHSLRHNAKHWLVAQVGERIADRQFGHAPQSVGRKYGFRSLQPEEIETIATAALPIGIDFSPFMQPH